MICYPCLAPILASLWLYTTIVHAQAPSNDECINATVIPPDTTLLPYVSPFVAIENATANVNDPDANCSDADVASVWYQWVPNTTDIYLVSIDNENLVGAISLFQGIDCGTLIAIGCAESDFPPSIENRFTANESYYIKVNMFPSADETIRLYVNTTVSPPSNAVCSNSTVVQEGNTVFGDLSFTNFAIPPTEIECGTFFADYPTLWYKVTNTDATPLVIVASTCNNSTSTDTVITVFKGNDCSALQCVGGVDDPFSDTCSIFLAEYTFLAEPSATYYIAVQSYSEVGNFTMSIETKSSYFALIDSNVDVVIGAVGTNLNYKQITSSNLNIEAVFEDTANIQSVMVTFDDQKKFSRCERKPPFSIFKDTDGDFWDGIISAGEHNVTAKSYAQPECAGEVGQSLTQKFLMEKCSYSFNFYLVSGGFTIFELPDFASSGIDSLPCDDINIEVVLDCGFAIEEVELKLVRFTYTATGLTERVIKSQTERIAPYYLYGNKGTVINTGTINAGQYNIEVSVNGISFDTGFDSETDSPLLEVFNDCSNDAFQAKGNNPTPFFTTKNGKP